MATYPESHRWPGMIYARYEGTVYTVDFEDDDEVGLVDYGSGREFVVAREKVDGVEACAGCGDALPGKVGPDRLCCECRGAVWQTGDHDMYRTEQGAYLGPTETGVWR